jgi:hypothetical protein
VRLDCLVSALQKQIGARAIGMGPARPELPLDRARCAPIGRLREAREQLVVGFRRARRGPAGHGPAALLAVLGVWRRRLCIGLLLILRIGRVSRVVQVRQVFAQRRQAWDRPIRIDLLGPCPHRDGEDGCE